MTDREPARISVAEAKRSFADVLGAIRHRGERFIIERNGTPMAALVPLEDLVAAPPPTFQAAGFLALVGAFQDAPEYADALGDEVHGRSGQAPRPPVQLDS